MLKQLEIYFNTTNLKGANLYKERKDKKAQQDLVLEFLKKNNNKEFTRSELQHFLEIKGIYIDRHSIGRCLTNLLNADMVIKLNDTRISPYGVGKPEHPYKFCKE